MQAPRYEFFPFLLPRDDGGGFDPDNRPGTRDGHFGIDGIKARLERIGGTLTIESSPGSGTKAIISIIQT